MKTKIILWNLSIHVAWPVAIPLLADSSLTSSKKPAPFGTYVPLIFIAVMFARTAMKSLALKLGLHLNLGCS